MSLFEDGRWVEARPLLQRIVAEAGPPEAFAALGISELVMSDQWDLADRLETIFEMLQYGGSTQWHDAIACQAWLELVRQRQISPKRIPTVLDTLGRLAPSSDLVSCVGVGYPSTDLL